MLAHLSIRNLAVVKTLDIDLGAGMTAITGETGAGKSIAIDALGLCLGDRADAGMVRSGCSKAEVSASFSVETLPQAQSWLLDNELDEEGECLIRRVISAEGRSKAYVNGSPVALQQLKQLGQLLVNIHGQNAHQHLLKHDHQRQILDDFAGHTPLLTQVSQAFGQLQEARKRYKALLAGQQQRADRRQLLEYQVQELDDFALAEDEFQTLEIEHKKLSHSQTLLEHAQLSFHQLYEADEGNALTAVQQSLDRIVRLQEHDATLEPIAGLLNEALINIEEASQELRAYTDQLEIDPLRMQQVEARYSQALDLARKQSVQPEQLYTCHMELTEELHNLNQDDDLVSTLSDEILALEEGYQQCAEKLSQSRQKAANELSRQVEAEIRQMNMPHAVFSIDVTMQPSIPASSAGLDEIVFMVSTNPGQSPDSMEKVVSGGELSRIGLAIQVISSSRNHIPTMIFDEVDTGISGPTASVVGQLLRRLGQQTQVICVTHLPQVAARGHQQMFVTKVSDATSTETHMLALTSDDRVRELARLLAGDQLTDSAIANARELLQCA